MTEAAALLARPGELVLAWLFGQWWMIHEGLADDERACEVFADG